MSSQDAAHRRGGNAKFTGNVCCGCVLVDNTALKPCQIRQGFATVTHRTARQAPLLHSTPHRGGADTARRCDVVAEAVAAYELIFQPAFVDTAGAASVRVRRIRTGSCTTASRWVPWNFVEVQRPCHGSSTGTTGIREKDAIGQCRRNGADAIPHN